MSTGKHAGYRQASDLLWGRAQVHDDREMSLLLAYQSGRLSMCDEWNDVDGAEGTNTGASTYARMSASEEAWAYLVVDEEASA